MLWTCFNFLIFLPLISHLIVSSQRPQLSWQPSVLHESWTCSEISPIFSLRFLVVLLRLLFSWRPFFFHEICPTSPIFPPFVFSYFPLPFSFVRCLRFFPSAFFGSLTTSPNFKEAFSFMKLFWYLSNFSLFLHDDFLPILPPPTPHSSSVIPSPLRNCFSYSFLLPIASLWQFRLSQSPGLSFSNDFYFLRTFS